jgi:beta-lactamase regulating signal transducer with metallopeptidase domain
MISWAIETLIASSILMLVVLAVRGPVARFFGPHIAYGLWLLPALRMLLPPLPEEVTPTPLHMLPSPIDIEFLLMAETAPADRLSAPLIEWPLLIGALWVAGGLAFLAWHILSYRRFVGKAMADATQLPRFDRDGVEVCASPAAPGPFAAGIFLKTIVLPEDYRRRYGRDELRLAIEHEVQHHRRCDMSANFFALVVLALHWWNPIAYFAHRAFRQDQELACDAMVLARATPDERHAYGSALLKSACDRLPVAACALGAGDDLKRRLKMMKTYRWSPARARAGSLIAATLVGGGLMLTASNGIAAETSKQVEEQVREVLAPVVPAIAPLAPPPPVAPAAPIAPVPPAAASDLPARVELALLHPHSAPLPPRAAVPPMPPMPPMYVDHDEISREVREEVEEARREAEEDRREALRDAAEARREALREAQQGFRAGERAREQAAHAREQGQRAREQGQRAREQAQRAREQAARAREHVQVSLQTCPKGHKLSVQATGSQTHVRCFGWSDKEKAEFRRSMLSGLQGARASIASMDARHMPPHAREQALESIDRQIERLRESN